MTSSQSETSFTDTLASLQQLAARDEARRALLKKLVEANQHVLASIKAEEPREILDVAVEQACYLSGADCAVLFPFNLAEQEFYDPDFVASCNLTHSLNLPSKPRRDGMAATVMDRGVFTVSNVAEQNLGFSEDSLPVREKIEAFAGISLSVGSEQYGVLYIDFRKPHAFENHEIETYRLFGDSVTLALSLSRTLVNNHRRAKQLSALNEIGIHLTSSAELETEQIVALIHQQVERLMDADNYYMARYDINQDEVSFALVMEDGQPVAIGQPPYNKRKAGRGLTELIIETRQPRLARHGVQILYDELGLQDYVGKLAKSWIGAPLLYGDDVLGVIATYNWQKEEVYDEQDVEVLQTIATQAATALHIGEKLQTQIHQLEFSYRRLETAREITQAVATELGIEQILYRIVTHFGCKYGLIQLVEEDKLAIHSQIGIAKSEVEYLRIPIGIGVTGRAAQQNRTIRVQDVKQEKTDEYLPYIVDTRSEIATPLRNSAGEVIGILDLEHTEPNAFDEDDEILLELVAESVVLALRNIEQVEQLKQKGERQRLAYLGALAGGVAHKIGGSVGLIGFDLNDFRRLANNSSPEFEEVLNRFEEERLYLGDLSETLLTPQLAHETPTEPIAISKLLKDAIKPAKNRLEGIDLTITNVENLPMIAGNKFLVEVFYELIRNAAKAMQHSERKSLNITGITFDTKNYVEVRFVDTGVGISPKHIDNIFELFFKVNYNKEVDKKGGFGLWLVKTILTQMGGDVLVTSEGKGKGSTFIVQLPVAQEGV